MNAVAGVVMFLGQVGQPALPQSEPETYEVFYHHSLRNRTDRELERVRVYLPIPPSDRYQRVEAFRIESSVQVRVSNRHDVFGTRMKRVEIPKISPGEAVEVGFSCIVHLSKPARIDLDPGKCGDAEIPKAIGDLYLRDHRIFGLQDAAIQDVAAGLLRDHANPVDRARAIHDLVASKLRYERGDGWDAAPIVLERRSGSCTEFCYLFCALCRATGIPTRMIGSSIFPARAKPPFQDRGWHRWVEAYLPGHGWVPFDATLDRARSPRQDFVGTHHGRTLILTKIGDKGRQLGLSYLGSNSHSRETTRSRWFTWSQGTEAKLDEANELLEKGRKSEAHRAMRKLARDYPDTRAGRAAKRALDKEQ